MGTKPSRLGLVLAGSYSLLALLAGGLIAYTLLFHVPNSELVGVPLIILTQPWCSLMFRATDALKLHPFMDRLWPVSTALLLGCAALNAFLLYKIGRALSQQVLRPKEKTLSRQGLIAVGLYSAVLLAAGLKMGLAIQAHADPGFSVWVLMICSEPWAFVLSVIARIMFGTIGLKWGYFLPMPAGVLINGFVVYALGAAFFRKKVS